MKYYFQAVLHPDNIIYMHEAISTGSHEVYSINPIPVEVSGDTEAEIEELLKALEGDSAKYKALKYEDLDIEMERWATAYQQPFYEDEEELETCEILDLVDYFERNK